MKRTIFFLFFFFSPILCMMSRSQQQPLLMKTWQKSFQKWRGKREQKKREVLGLFGQIPLEIVPMVMGDLDYKSNVRFIMTCKEFYNSYADKNDILFTKHYLNSSDYTDAMIFFARKNDANKVELLMKHEGPINKKNREEIKKNKEEIYEEIYENLWGFSFSYYECDPLIDIIIKIYQRKFYESNLDCSIRNIITNKKNAYLELICKQGYDLNALGESGHTKLHIATYSHDIDYLKSLLCLDASLVDRNIKDEYGDTVLHSAVLRSNVEIIQLLLADPHVDHDIKDEQGKTAYDYAKSLGIIKFLSGTFFYDKYNEKKIKKRENKIKGLKTSILYCKIGIGLELVVLSLGVIYLYKLLG